MAQLQGVEVLNINELANSLKPIVLPGETMRVFILKEGKEYNQGVAYLDDGTMVVVDNARKMIGKTIDIAVTSVLQTTAGKMIFGKFDERGRVHGGNRLAGMPGNGKKRVTRSAAGPSGSAGGASTVIDHTNDQQKGGKLDAAFSSWFWVSSRLHINSSVAMKFPRVPRSFASPRSAY